MPAEDRHRIARLLVIVREYRRKLLESHMRGKFVPAIIEPRLRIQRRVVSSTNRIIPAPAFQRIPIGMPGEQNFCHAACFVLRFLKHRELVRVHRLKLVDARLQMPSRKIATIASRKRTRSKTANWCALPVAVINMAGPQRGLARACIRQRLSDWAPPCGLWNVIAERGRNTAK